MFREPAANTDPKSVNLLLLFANDPACFPLGNNFPMQRVL